MAEIKLWLTSDFHFRHYRVIELEGRPNDYEIRIRNSLMRLTKDDILINLGDICIGEDQLVHNWVFKKLKCRKILVRGNHDTKSDNWYLNNGWDFVCREFSGKYFGKNIIFTHIPKQYDQTMYDLNIHGHLHSNRYRGSSDVSEFGGRKYCLISPEFNKYQPVTLKSLLQ